MKQRNSKGRRSAGFTVVEVMIAVVLSGLMLGAITVIFDSNRKALRTGATADNLEEQAYQTVHEIRKLLAASGTDAITPMPVHPLHTSAIQFQRGVDIDNAELVWSDPERLVLEYSPSEKNNGVDDDGNGLVDECRILWIQDEGGPNERTIVVSNWVSEYLEGENADKKDDNGNGMAAERGLTFTFDEDLITVYLTLQRPDPNGLMLTKTVSTTIALRN